jgi:hypothetical protein
MRRTDREGYPDVVVHLEQGITMEAAYAAWVGVLKHPGRADLVEIIDELLTGQPWQRRLG